MKITTLLLGSACCFALNIGAFAEEISATDTQELSFRSFLTTMNANGGSNNVQWQVAPTYSELFGLGVRATVGGYVADDFALGVIIDYAEYREEYLANAGVRINDNMRVIGSVGILKEQEDFIDGEGREDVQQLEYGLSLKGNYDAGMVRGFELNAYHANASSDTDNVETGDLTGVQVAMQLKPADSTDIRVGAGYERAEWDGGDVDEGFTLQALGAHKLSDTLSMNFEAKYAETENVYGLGLTYDMSTVDVQNSALSIDIMRIDGKHGISDDTRVAVNWTVGFGAGASDATVSSMGSIARTDLLADVRTRPAFLPVRVLVRSETYSNDFTPNAICGVGGPFGSGKFVFLNEELDDARVITWEQGEGGEDDTIALPETSTVKIGDVTFTRQDDFQYRAVGVKNILLLETNYTLTVDGPIRCQLQVFARDVLDD